MAKLLIAKKKVRENNEWSVVGRSFLV